MSLELKEILVVAGCLVAAAIAVAIWFLLTPKASNDSPAGETDVSGGGGDGGISH